MADPALEQLSGWILPDGSWRPVEEWWHVSALYDYISEGLDFALTDFFQSTLKEGDEAKIRDMASKAGLVKVGKRIIDAYVISTLQLRTLQEIYALCSPDTELEWLQEGGVSTVLVVSKLLKLRKMESKAL
jgi:hypothetical protein